VSSSSDVLLDSIYAGAIVDTGTNKFQGQVSESGYFIGTKNSYTLFSTSEYTLALTAVYNQVSSSITIQGNTPKVDIYLVGVNNTRILDNNPLGQRIGQITILDVANLFENKQFNFKPQVTVVVSNGFWNFSNISIRPASDPQFSPDEIRVLVPNTEYHNKPLRYKIEFVDINNNSVNINATSTPVFFTGSAMDLGTLP
jgi:hypothetical protein